MSQGQVEFLEQSSFFFRSCQKVSDCSSEKLGRGIWSLVHWEGCKVRLAQAQLLENLLNGLLPHAHGLSTVPSLPLLSMPFLASRLYRIPSSLPTWGPATSGSCVSGVQVPATKVNSTFWFLLPFLGYPVLFFMFSHQAHILWTIISLDSTV